MAPVYTGVIQNFGKIYKIVMKFLDGDIYLWYTLDIIICSPNLEYKYKGKTGQFMNLKTQKFSFRTIKGYGLAGAVIASVLFSQGVVAADTVKPTTDARIEAAEQPRAVELGSVVVTHYDTNGSQLALDVVAKLHI